MKEYPAVLPSLVKEGSGEFVPMSLQIFNQPQSKNLRRELRKNQTPQERAIWNIVRNRQINNYKFFRQYGIGKYIIDFYCPELLLAIEIDGGQHNETQNKNNDNQRTNYLNTLHITVLRFWNNDITGNLEGVYDRIVETIKSIKK